MKAIYGRNPSLNNIYTSILPTKHIMGLEEHIKAGAQLTRDTIVLTAPTGSGSIDFGSVFSILKIQTDTPVRFRLYETTGSRDNVVEINRPFGQFISTASISLIGDFSMSAFGTYTITPPVYGVGRNRSSSEVYYRLENDVGQPSVATLRITRFLIEDKAILPQTGTFYTVDNRRTLLIESPHEMPNLSHISGTLNLSPKTYMMISASASSSVASPSLQQVRLRLYATSSAIDTTTLGLTEASRSISTEPSESVMLLVDAYISGSDTLFFAPKIFGANLETMGDDLIETETSTTKTAGNSEIYYWITNEAGFSATPIVKLAVYSLED